MLKRYSLMAFGLALLASFAFGADPYGGGMSEDEAAGILALLGIGIMGLMVIMLFGFIITIFFIISQNRLIDAMAKDENSIPVNKAWTWTQLIPLWNYIALAVSISKLSNQYQEYVSKKGAPSTAFNPTMGWVYFVASVISLFIGFAWVVALIFWIVYWINISGTTKCILFEKND
jgi:hypothetical protein